MTAGNRATKYENLYKSLKKHFKPLTEVPERTVLEHLLYACCLEDAKSEHADEAFAKLQQTYFDWNEVRVTTVVELSEALHSLPFADQAAQRIKKCLQSLFESRYQYDLEDLKKANLGKAIAELEAWKGITPFVVSYVSQHSLGGHSIPASALILDALVQCEILTPAEAEKKLIPGVERAIPKNKGTEFASILHQFAVELHLHPKAATPSAVLKDMGVTYKIKEKPVEKPSSSSKGTAAKATLKTAPADNAPGKGPSQAKSIEESKAVDTKGSKKPDSKKPEPSKGSETPKTSGKKIESKPTAKPVAGNKPKVATKPEAPASKKAASTKSSAEPNKSPKKAVKKEPPKTKAGGKANTDSKAMEEGDKKSKSTDKLTGRTSVGSSITKKKPK
jgi:endonuclease III